MNIVIRPRGGLCNKLRFLLSYYAYAKIQEKKLIVIWEKDQYCPGFFLDYFEPLDGATFMENNDEKLKIDFTGFDWRPEDTMDIKIDCCKYLVLIPEIQNAVSELINTMENNYIAIHVRRTDHVELSKQHSVYTSDEDFFNFIDKHPDKKVFLATDNNETQDNFISKYGDRIYIYKEIINSESLRKTDLLNSIIDIFTCSNADNFLGSGWSSFSQLIRYLTQARTNK